jgi:Sec-independent protein translocase protein TatA
MEILGIGIPELLLIVLLILILFGPKDMIATGRTLGKWLNQLVRSPTYKLLTKTGEELKNLPRNLMRETNLEEYKKEMQQIGKDLNNTTQSIGGSLTRSFDERKIFEQPTSDAKATPSDPSAATAPEIATSAEKPADGE